MTIRGCTSRLLWIAGALICLACAPDDELVGPPAGGDQNQVQTQPVGIDHSMPAGTPRILVDASRDGGAWWFPQVAPFSGSAAHQGKRFADGMRAEGYVVEELPRPFTITASVLGSYNVVVRATGFGGYSAAELDAYSQYVNNGGALLLLGDHMLNLSADLLAQHFGITFAGITRGDNVLSTFANHPITKDVVPLQYMVGSGITGMPASAQIVGRLSSNSYLDLNKNGLRDSTETDAPAVLGVMSSGSGRIVFCGDTNLWEQIPQPLLKNVLAWFKDPT